ncbi:type II nitroreductase [Sporothrix epigloea]|uniref:Type II nitroreductase n=1 Tax=Sporothrix epigloea TaxID=1892477 RepID=A0ABP0E4Z5_9PEZI
MASSTKPNADTLLELIKGRRSYYALSKDLSISKDRIQEIVKEAILQVPSSFNSQSNRVIVLFGDEHDKFWSIVRETLQAFGTPETREKTNSRLAMFDASAGTILFFEDQTVVENFQSKFAIYADRFPGWAQQSDAMLQFALWTALEAEGLGANLQHYNPIVDDKVAAAWNVPSTWKLNAQLVFGGRAGEVGPKEQIPIEDRLKVYGA